MSTIAGKTLLCAWVIGSSIAAEIPVRGATSFGEFEISENIFVGKAIDEAASWHEQSDWIGVHLTPSAEYVFTPTEENGSIWARFTPPNKTRLVWQPFCVDWTKGWDDRVQELAVVKLRFRRLGPIVPEIAPKFANTLHFVVCMSLKAAARAESAKAENGY